MNEDFLHFIWKFKLYDKDALYTTDNEIVEIKSVGLPNNGAGPDFLNARIKIGDTEWVGNVEIHIKSSNWVQHKHHFDKAYNNVILHVVKYYDNDAFRQNNSKIPILVLKYDEQLECRYEQLLASQVIIPCQPCIKNIDPFIIRHFLNRILVERLERKSADIVQSLGNSKNNWREAFYQLLFKAFGFGTNALPFQLLAKHTPLRIIEKYGDNVFVIEALLYGQAGFLEDEPKDDYHAKLKTEYIFLKTTYNLTPLDKSIWKFGRLRPANFPTLRITQLAKLVSTMDGIIELIIKHKTVDDFFVSVMANVSTYWETHYDFGKESSKQNKLLGHKSLEKIISNVAVPFLFTYGKAKADNAMQEKALLLLDALPPESNSIIDMWKAIGIKADNAFYSQALIQLKSGYCDNKRCLSCAIGKIIIERG
ncbi:MAG: DUF2851 family protein [Prevotellaceae bacterium]|jgi:hypothetical protein|nr:DUF2851 family protein [Prevotellaceae bacterium]